MFREQLTSCPRCQKQAEGKYGIECAFGFRNLRGQLKPQSHCRACRIEQLRGSR